MIIVDAPPVLSVSDALSIGRWTDGAPPSATRRADSPIRPADRRLARVGVSVLGAVVNGVRSPESRYGGYHAYGSSPAPSRDPRHLTRRAVARGAVRRRGWVRSA